MIFNLYKNELSKIKKETILFIALSLLLNIFFLYKSYNGWNPDSVIGINVVLMGMTFIIPIMLTESKFISQEWKDNTIYLKMSLPIAGKEIFLAKYAAVITQYIIISLTSILIFAVQFIVFLKRTNEFNHFLNGIKEIASITTFNTSIFLYIFSIVGLLYLISIIFLSSIVGKMFKKYSGLITFVCGIATIIISGKTIGFLMNTIFGSMNTNIIYNVNQPHVEKIIDTIRHFGYFCLGSSAIFLTITSIIYIIMCRIYDKKIEL